MRRYRPLQALPDIPRFPNATTTMEKRNFLEYLPKRFKARNEQDEKVRRFIYDFKCGRAKAARWAAVAVANYFFNCFGSQCEEYTIVCVPSRSLSTYRRRFSYFAKEVSELCGIQNAMEHVIIIGERQALHNSKSHCVCEDGYDVIIDTDYFKGRKVIVFDDLYTSGASATRFADELTAAGAQVVSGLFLAKTIWKGGQYESK